MFLAVIRALQRPFSLYLQNSTGPNDQASDAAAPEIMAAQTSDTGTPGSGSQVLRESLVTSETPSSGSQVQQAPDATSELSASSSQVQQGTDARSDTPGSGSQQVQGPEPTSAVPGSGGQELQGTDVRSETPSSGSQSLPGASDQASDTAAAASLAAQTVAAPDAGIPPTIPGSVVSGSGSQVLLVAATSAAVGGAVFWTKVTAVSLHQLSLTIFDMEKLACSLLICLCLSTGARSAPVPGSADSGAAADSISRKQVDRDRSDSAAGLISAVSNPVAGATAAAELAG